MSFRVTLKIDGLKDVKDTLRRIATPGEINQVVAEAMDEQADFIVERARLNAPILTGALRENLAHSDANARGDKITVDIGVEDPDIAEYALRWHENPFNKGPVSAQQPNTVEGGVGWKYISRPINYHFKRIVKNLGDAIIRYIERK